MVFTIGTNANGYVSLSAAQNACNRDSLLGCINLINTYTTTRTGLRSLIGTWGVPTPSITNQSIVYGDFVQYVNAFPMTWTFTIANFTSLYYIDTMTITSLNYYISGNILTVTGYVSPSVTPTIRLILDNNVNNNLERFDTGYWVYGTTAPISVTMVAHWNVIPDALPKLTRMYNGVESGLLQAATNLGQDWLWYYAEDAGHGGVDVIDQSNGNLLYNT